MDAFFTSSRPRAKSLKLSHESTVLPQSTTSDQSQLQAEVVKSRDSWTVPGFERLPSLSSGSDAFDWSNISTFVCKSPFDSHGFLHSDYRSNLTFDMSTEALVCECVPFHAFAIEAIPATFPCLSFTALFNVCLSILKFLMRFKLTELLGLSASRIPNSESTSSIRVYSAGKSICRLCRHSRCTKGIQQSEHILSRMEAQMDPYEGIPPKA